LYFCVSIVYEKPQQKQRINLTLSLKYMRVTVTVRTRSDIEVNCLVRLKQNSSWTLLYGNDLLKICKVFWPLEDLSNNLLADSVNCHHITNEVNFKPCRGRNSWIMALGWFTLFIQSSCHLLKTSSVIK